jgi:Coenzyme PQQ synthesis protein D (PqqD)
MNLTLRKNVSIVHAETGTILLNERTGRYWQLNTSGMLVLDILRNGGTVYDACRALTDRYPVDYDQAAADIDALLVILRSAGLVTS